MVGFRSLVDVFPSIPIAARYRGWFFLPLLLIFLCPIDDALAYVNRGGKLIIHTDDRVEYTAGKTYYGLSGIECPNDFNCPYDFDCSPNLQLANPTSGLGGEIAVWWVLAAFPTDSCPNLKGVTFGVDYDPQKVVLVDWGTVTHFEISTDNWPTDPTGVGTALVWCDPFINQLVEVYWFAGYAPYGPATFELRPHPTQGGYFGDSSSPSDLDAITGYAVLGLNGAVGTNPPLDFSALGACCTQDGSCTVAKESDCLGDFGHFQGADSACNPEPCQSGLLPKASIGPLSFKLEISAGENARAPITMWNTGEGGLEYSLRTGDSDFKVTYPKNGVVRSMRAEIVPLEVSTMGLSLGPYNGQVILQTNDPAHRRTVIDIDLEVVPPPEPVIDYSELPLYFRPFNTGNAGTVLISSTQDGLLRYGDEVGLFVGETVVGCSRYLDALPIPITVWEADPEFGFPGISHGDPITARIWDPRKASVSPSRLELPGGDMAVYSPDLYTEVSLGSSRSQPGSPIENAVDPFAGKSISVFPNPVLSSTEIRYRLSSPAKVDVAIFDPHGRKVRALFSGPQGFGNFAFRWDGTDDAGQELPSGAYFVRVNSPEMKAQSRVILIR